MSFAMPLRPRQRPELIAAAATRSYATESSEPGLPFLDRLGVAGFVDDQAPETAFGDCGTEVLEDEPRRCSDNLICVRQVTATEAARHFSEMLDAIESRRESFVVMRRGRPVATVGPASGSTGRDLREILKRNRPDAAWADELRELRESIGSETDPWRA
jgi:antitoxin (DNA-binding transcriptional repressor) of toxin-antitoxin stability system